jgi:hypothetical protein
MLAIAVRIRCDTVKRHRLPAMRLSDDYGTLGCMRVVQAGRAIKDTLQTEL